MTTKAKWPMDPQGYHGSHHIEVPTGLSYQGNKGGITTFSKQSNFRLFSQFCFSPTTLLKCSVLGSGPTAATVSGVTLAEQTSQRGDWRDRRPTSTSVHLAQQGPQMREHLFFIIPGVKLSYESGKMSCLTQSTLFPEEAEDAQIVPCCWL